MPRGRVARALLALWALLCASFVIAPLVVLFVVSFAKGNFIGLPKHGLTLHWWAEALDSEQFRDAAWQSFKLAVVSSLISFVIGVPAGRVLAGGRSRLAPVGRLAAISPLIVPEIMTALAILSFFSITGWTHDYLRLLLGHVLITLPFIVQLSATALSRFNVHQEWAARSLGANALTAFARVTVPQIRTELIVAVTFAFVVSWNNAGISIFLAGNNQHLLPVVLYSDIQFDTSPVVVAVSAELIVVSALVAIVLHRFFGLENLSDHGARRNGRREAAAPIPTAPSA